MNNLTRKKLKEVISTMEEMKVIVSDIAEEEQSKFDNLPEGLQSSETGQKLEESASSLEEIIGSIDDLIDNIETVIE